MSTSTLAAEPWRVARHAIGHGAIQKEDELRALLELLAGRKLKSILEIGTLHGGTLYALCQIAHPYATIISLDLPGGPFGGGPNADDEQRIPTYAGPGQSIAIIRADSHESDTVRTVESIVYRRPGTMLDLLLIDGDHREAGVRSDYELYSPFVKTSGLIVFHDIVPHPDAPDCQVDVVWEELKRRHRHREIISSDGGEWGGIGVLYNG